MAAASKTQPGSGVLAGLTQISYGCPGPVSIGQPTCESWHPFPHAHFGIRQIGPRGQPLPQIIRVVTSDRQGRFSARLTTGDYQLTPLVQTHSSGGRKLTIHIRPDHTTRIVVRFLGVPRMV
jgi:hypothetical protein